MTKDLSSLFIYPKAWINNEAMDIAKSVRNWANKEIVSNRLEYIKDYHTLFMSVREKLALDIGFQGLIFPEKNGGLGFDDTNHAPSIVTFLMEASRADMSIGFIHAIEYVVSSLFTLAPTKLDDLCDAFSGIFCRNKIGTASLILPGVGKNGDNDPLFHGKSIHARIKVSDGGNILTGKSLRPIGNGTDATLFCVVCANAEGEPCIVLVSKEETEIRRSKPIKETGLDGCCNSDVSFDDVAIRKQNIIARKTAVYEIHSWLNLLLGAVSVGGCMGCLEILYEWAETRTIKGNGLLKDNPLCASVLADVAEEIFVARLLVYNLAHTLVNPSEWGDSGSQHVYTTAQMIGRRVQEGCLKAVNRSMELMASQGYAKEGGVEKFWRDIKTVQSYLCGVGAEVPVKMDIARYFFDCKEI